MDLWRRYHAFQHPVSDAWFLILQDDETNARRTLSTTALSAIPLGHPRRFRAIDAARECLRICRYIGKIYLDNLYNWTVFCHWVLLRVPLTPFTGIFYNVLANPQTSQEDLQLLEDFVASLEPARRLSDGIDKFYQLCAIYVKVTQAYVRAKAQQQPPSNYNPALQIPLQVPQPVMGEINEHVSAAGPYGLPKTIDANGADLADGTVSGSVTLDISEQQEHLFDMSNLPDWYSGNVSLYGLLDQDFNDMDEMAFGIFGDGTDHV